MRAASRVDIASRAAETAEKAAAKAGVRILELESLDQITAAARLYAAVWSAEIPPVPVELLRAFAHAGNYVAGAFAGNELVGALCGFLGRREEEVHLHSHILGVVPGLQSRGMGFALKQHQRVWALAQGIERVVWTHDPLVARNAYFNLMKLGADAEDYYVNFYGLMNDGMNAGQASDRLLVAWRVSSDRAIAASTGLLLEPDLNELKSEGATLALDEIDEAPVVYPAAGATLLCKVPADIVSLRARDLDLAARWRVALRETLGKRISDGYQVRGITRHGWYVLSAP